MIPDGHLFADPIPEEGPEKAKHSDCTNRNHSRRFESGEWRVLMGFLHAMAPDSESVQMKVVERTRLHRGAG